MTEEVEKYSFIEPNEFVVELISIMPDDNFIRLRENNQLIEYPAWDESMFEDQRGNDHFVVKPMAFICNGQKRCQTSFDGHKLETECMFNECSETMDK